MTIALKFILPVLLFVNNLMPATMRKLYIFGKEANEVLTSRQLALLKAAFADVKERDIEIIVIQPNSQLYKQYNVKPGEFTIVLIGKDGGEKYRVNRLLEPKELFAIIDAMPMRKQEIKRKNGAD